MWGDILKETEIKITLKALIGSLGKLLVRAKLVESEDKCREYLEGELSSSSLVLSECFPDAKSGDEDNILLNLSQMIADAQEFGYKVTADTKDSLYNPIKSIFNRLNGNSDNKVLKPFILGNEEGSISFPEDGNVKVDCEFYKNICRELVGSLKNINKNSFNGVGLNSFISTMEAVASFVPFSTSDDSLTDISYYDHCRVTAAIAASLKGYLKENEEAKSKLFTSAQDVLSYDSLLLFTLDISGIQNFIYTISSEGALKSLRARSFYLEAIMEHIADELLERLSLSRANLVYSGAGHAHLILPNTTSVRELLDSFTAEVNNWFIKNFNTLLYVAGEYVEVSGLELSNKPQGSLTRVYQNLVDKLTVRKNQRYSYDDLRHLNGLSQSGKRECRICHRTGNVNSDGCCVTCSSLMAMSKSILDKGYFMVVRDKKNRDALILPFGCYLVGCTDEEARSKVCDDSFVRLYAKNQTSFNEVYCSHLWVGSYSEDDLNNYAKKADGIKRIGIVRADVDNLGVTFAFGFVNKKLQNQDRYATLSRKASLSRMLSLFFKYYINHILENPENTVLAECTKRKVSIVYSGGDDVFLLGTWNEVISAFVDLRENFRKFCQNTLSISGGAGIYPDKFPVHIMAREAEGLESAAKDIDNKNGISLFDPEFAFNFDDFINKVMKEKFTIIQDFFIKNKIIKMNANNEQASLDHSFGSSFLYKIIELMRNSDKKINRARLAYLLSRMEPGKDASSEAKKSYKEFKKSIIDWYPSSRDRNELIAACYLYVYLIRQN